MPILYSWLISSESISPEIGDPVIVFPSGGSPDPTTCDGVMFDKSHFLDVFDSVMARDWIEPLKSSPESGYDLLRAFAAVGERISKAIESFECGAFAIFAEGGQIATGNVELYRDETNFVALTVKRGTIVCTSQGGRYFITLEDAFFDTNDVGPVVVPVQAAQYGAQWNVQGQIISLSGEIVPGQIDTIAKCYQDPPYADPAIKVRQIVATTGGKEQWLDGLGEDKDIRRNVGESDKYYRYRVRNLPDTVSPAAIRRALDPMFERIGLTYELVESFDPDLGILDDPRTVGTHFDEPAGAPPLRWRFGEDFAFYVVVPVSSPMLDYGMMFDDPATTGAEFENPQGFRATSAFDVTVVNNSQIVQGALDGQDIGLQRFYKSVYDTLQQIKAGGVRHTLVLEGT